MKNSLLMSALASAFLSSTFSLTTHANSENSNPPPAVICSSELTKSHESLHKGLSPYWAQSLIGADFAKSLLRALARNAKPLKEIHVTNMDGGMDPTQVDVTLTGAAAGFKTKFGDNHAHGDKTMNVLAGRGEYGVGDHHVVQFSDVLTYSDNADFDDYTEPKNEAESTALKKFDAVLENELKRLSQEIGELHRLDADLTAQGWPDSLAQLRAQNQKRLTQTILGSMRETDANSFDSLMASNPKLIPSQIKIYLQHTDEPNSIFFSGKVAKMASEVLATHPDILNFEVQIIAALRGTNNIALNQFLSQVSQSTLIVSAAGNVYQAQTPSQGRLIHGTDVVVVGNLLPSGLTDPSSSASGDVNIMAPAGSVLLSHLNHLDDSSPDTYDENFGGTSGATPEVSGALGNAFSILSSLTPKQAIALLKATSIPLSYSGEGVGMLNAYKLVAVATRLKVEGWPKNANQLLRNPAVFQFKSDADKLRQRLKTKAKPGNCDFQFARLQLLRRIFLLDSNKTEASEIAKIYRAFGYPEDAKFYEIFAASNELRNEIAGSMKVPQNGDKFPEADQDTLKRNPRFFR